MLSRGQRSRLQAGEMRNLIRNVGVSLFDKVTNEEIRRTPKVRLVKVRKR